MFPGFYRRSSDLQRSGKSQETSLLGLIAPTDRQPGLDVVVPYLVADGIQDRQAQRTCAAVGPVAAAPGVLEGIEATNGAAGTESEHVRFRPAGDLDRRLVYLAHTEVFIHHKEYHRGMRVNGGKFGVSDAHLLLGALALGNVPEPDRDTVPCRRRHADVQPERQSGVVVFEGHGNALRHDAPALEFQFAAREG